MAFTDRRTLQVIGQALSDGRKESIPRHVRWGRLWFNKIAAPWTSCRRWDDWRMERCVQRPIELTSMTNAVAILVFPEQSASAANERKQTTTFFTRTKPVSCQCLDNLIGDSYRRGSIGRVYVVVVSSESAKRVRTVAVRDAAG